MGPCQAVGLRMPVASPPPAGAPWTFLDAVSVHGCCAGEGRGTSSCI